MIGKICTWHQSLLLSLAYPTEVARKKLETHSLLLRVPHILPSWRKSRLGPTSFPGSCLYFIFIFVVSQPRLFIHRWFTNLARSVHLKHTRCVGHKLIRALVYFLLQQTDKIFCLIWRLPAGLLLLCQWLLAESSNFSARQFWTRVATEGLLVVYIFGWISNFVRASTMWTFCLPLLVLFLILSVQRGLGSHPSSSE